MFGTDISMDLLIQYGLQAGSALLILGIGVFLARSAGQYTHRSLAKIEMEAPVRLLVVRIVKGIMVLFTLLVVLQQFGIQIFPLIAGLGVAGIGIGLALQGVFLNLFAGLSIIFTKPFRIGEFIDILGEHGQFFTESNSDAHDGIALKRPIHGTTLRRIVPWTTIHASPGEEAPKGLSL